MDHKKTYEQTVADKLEALPVPDLADAIWSRIGTQLDIEIPTDEGDGNEPGSPSKGGWLGPAGFSILIVACITAFIHYKNNKIPEPFFQTEKVTQPIAPPPLEEKRNSVPDKKRSMKVLLPATRFVNPVNKSSADRTSDIAAPVLVPTDSVRQLIVVPPPPLPGAGVASPAKKTRGVSGITDNDYRIVPAKKDST